MQSKQDMINRIDDLVDLLCLAFSHCNQLVSESVKKAIEYENKSLVKIYAYKYVDTSTGKRYVAIGGINLLQKDETIKKLNIRTTKLNCNNTDSIHSWCMLLEEYNNKSDDTALVKINNTEVLDFEDPKIVVTQHFFGGTNLDDNVNELLVLQENDSDFFANHYRSKSKDIFFLKRGLIPAYRYPLKKYRITSPEEVDVLVDRLITSYRTITGKTGVEVTIMQYFVSEYVWDVCIGISSLPYKKIDIEKEDAKF
jgi:hypothetical protein